jgi:hypothetical protein
MAAVPSIDVHWCLEYFVPGVRSFVAHWVFSIGSDEHRVWLWSRPASAFRMGRRHAIRRIK